MEFPETAVWPNGEENACGKNPYTSSSKVLSMKFAWCLDHSCDDQCMHALALYVSILYVRISIKGHIKYFPYFTATL